MSGPELIAQERARQISEEGWTLEHDDEHVGGELGDAATAYIEAARFARINEGQTMPLLHSMWPWDDSWWKPSEDPVRNLVKAGALIVAEIERLQRIEE